MHPPEEEHRVTNHWSLRGQGNVLRPWGRCPMSPRRHPQWKRTVGAAPPLPHGARAGRVASPRGRGRPRPSRTHRSVCLTTRRPQLRSTGKPETCQGLHVQHSPPHKATPPLSLQRVPAALPRGEPRGSVPGRTGLPAAELRARPLLLHIAKRFKGGDLVWGTLKPSPQDTCESRAPGSPRTNRMRESGVLSGFYPKVATHSHEWPLGT